MTLVLCTILKMVVDCALSNVLHSDIKVLSEHQSVFIDHQIHTPRLFVKSIINHEFGQIARIARI